MARMRTHSLAGSSGAIDVLASLSARGSGKAPFFWGALALADCSDRLRKAARRAEKLDRLFWHPVRMARLGPDVHFAVNREIEEPYRTGRCVVLHLEPFRTGLVVGWYGRERLGEFEALRRAVSLSDPTQKQLDDFDDDKLHGPGQPGRLRFGAAGGSGQRGGRPEPRVAAPADAGAGQ